MSQTSAIEKMVERAVNAQRECVERAAMARCERVEARVAALELELLVLRTRVRGLERNEDNRATGEHVPAFVAQRLAMTLAQLRAIQTTPEGGNQR